MDVTTLIGSLIDFAVGAAIVCSLRKERRRIMIGIGGPVIGLGFMLVAIAYGLISGVTVWVITGAMLTTFVKYSYAASRRAS